MLSTYVDLSDTVIFFAIPGSSPTFYVYIVLIADYNYRYGHNLIIVYYLVKAPCYMNDTQFRLRPSSFDTLLDLLSETSDPFHERYGKHLSKAQVDELMRPSNETLQEVKNWLNWHGIADPELSTSLDRSIALTVPVFLAETMLNTTYHVFEHAKSQKKTLRTLEYSLPRHLHSHINLVSPTTYFGTTESMRANSFLQSRASGSNLTGDTTPLIGCVDTVAPTCLKDLYNTANYIPTQISRNGIGIPGFIDQYASFSDLTTFTQDFLAPGHQRNLHCEATVVGIQLTCKLDLFCEHLRAGITGGDDGFESFLDWLDFIATVPDDLLPNTFSTSYGDDEQNVPADFAVELCSGFAELGARGARLMFTSGDTGVAGALCETNDGVFRPAFPARQLPLCGGFSNLFARPSYQEDVVSAFLIADGNNNAGLFNTTGRAYPDVAARGQGFQTILDGLVETIDSTAGSSPTFAGVIALLNDFKLAQDGTTLGFLNPLLYANPTALNDITIGTNAGCGASGFDAGVGWDPVTGLGTPDFVELQAII
ncbi:hypothetical protein GYMLUDRAFT_260483 [Collybiopsis luxurians FD-317 M1]|uniref:Peptidase S53 domain-containing protein n=1 Tax=Collybiopsis luxurians FD-317 M1 TaxID=944289 RepID=A0A0D0CZF7_9AGAR|nr:hypothetical protein GYMLUDRAFT_260483 [Collybiopsis luxurians FD-317 M1]